jgi:flagellar assembly protein FliH
MAGIIKAGRNEPPSGSPVRAFHFDDVGRVYLDRVRAEAAKIVAEARREAAQIKTKAAEEGHQAAAIAAQAALQARLDQQLASVTAALGEAAKNIDRSRHAWQRHWEEHTVALGAAIAERLCRSELTRRPEISRAWIREALELAAGNAQIVLHLNPADHQALATQIDGITRQLAGLGPVEVVADPAISAGGCRVETQFGALDQQLAAQLARITEELLA